MRHYVSPSALKAKYKTDSLEEISKCFYVEGGASLFEVLGYPSAAPSEPAPSESAPSEPAPSEPAPSEPAPSEPAPSESVPPVVVPSAPGRFPSPPEVELEALLQQAQTLFEEAQLAEDRVEEANKALATVNATQEDVKRAAVTAVAEKKEDALRSQENWITWETLDAWRAIDEAVASSQAALAKVEAEVRAAQTEAHEARKCRVLAWNALVSVGMTMTNTAIMLRIRP